jgi:hypothetical protein
VRCFLSVHHHALTVLAVVTLAVFTLELKPSVACSLSVLSVVRLLAQNVLPLPVARAGDNLVALLDVARSVVGALRRLFAVLGAKLSAAIAVKQ